MFTAREIEEREATESLGHELWESILSRALELRHHEANSRSASPPRCLPLAEFCRAFLWLLDKQRQFHLDPDDGDEEDEEEQPYISETAVRDRWMLSVILSDRGESEPDRPHVSRSQFILFLLRFGPFEYCLDKVRDILEHGKVWFHGNQSRDASERVLEEHPRDGLFLVRYSSTPGHFTVDYIKHGKVFHFNGIHNNFSGPGIVVNVKLESEAMREFKYSSFSSFINKNKHLYSEPCLNLRSHFHWAKLAMPPPGAFLPDIRATDAKERADESDDEDEDSSDHAINVRISSSFDSDGRSELVLRSMHIGPNPPKQIDGLSYLHVLDLSGNSIKNVSGVEFASLEELEALILSNNQLSQLPGTLFSSLPSLKRFECSDNFLTHLPKEIFEIDGLHHLDLSNNRIEEFPVDLINLEHLQFLDVSGNAIKTLPDKIGSLRQLEELNVSNNHLSCLPSSTSNLCNLVLLNIENNRINDISLAQALMVSNPYLEVKHEGHLLKSLVVPRNELQSSNGAVALRRNVSLDIFSLLNLDGVAEHHHHYHRVLGHSDTLDLHRSRKLNLSTCSRSRSSSSLSIKLWASNDAYWVEYGRGEKPSASSLCLQEHINIADYRKHFYLKTVHANIIGQDRDLGPICISIQKQPTSVDETENLESDSGYSAAMALLAFKSVTSSLDHKSLFYRALVRTQQGDRRLMIPSKLVHHTRKREHYARSEDLLAALRRLTKPMFTSSKLRVIRDPASHPKFAELEDKLITNSYKFGVLYALEGQDENAMYSNPQGSAAFKRFMGLLGDRVCMKGWTKYTGGLSTNSDTLHSYYTTHEGYEIMFHVSTELPLNSKMDQFGQQWERKRFLGNDIVLVVFYEGQTPINPATFVSNFNHVFALVRPDVVGSETTYHLEMCYKNGVVESMPHLPHTTTFNHSDYFRRFLLTKLINAERCALSAPQFCRLQERVREELFEGLLIDFPKQKKNRKAKQLLQQQRQERKEPPTYYVDPGVAQILLKMIKGEK